MSSPSDNQFFEAYLPVYDVVPDKWEDARPFMVEQFKKISTAVNIREIGWFIDEEVLSGKAFIPGLNNVLGGATSQQFRQVFRKVVDFGTLPNAGTKSVPHGITVDNNFTLTFLGAYATDPISLTSFPIPYCDPLALASGVALTLSATTVNITTGIDRTNFTRCFITIEYMQEL